MTALLRAEFRKLLTVRSTYVISILALLLVGFLGFYVAGFKGTGAEPFWLIRIFGEVSTTIAIFVSLVTILLMGHEYRYNTIMYTLTSANSRTKVLIAKIAASLSYAVVLLALTILFGILTYWLGVLFSPNAGRMIVSPDFYWSDLWRAFFYVGAFGLMGLLFAFIFRHLVGAIAALFILPTIEGLLSLLLKDNVKYLPFSALEQIHTADLWSPGKAALLVTAYMAGAWIVTWYLFLRRDAN